MTEQEQIKQLAESLTEKEISELAGGRMDEEQRKKLAKILGIAIPAGAVGAVVIGCGVAVLAGKFGEHGDASYYFTHPFGKDPYGLNKTTTPPSESAEPSIPTLTPSNLGSTPVSHHRRAPSGGLPLPGMAQNDQ